MICLAREEAKVPVAKVPVAKVSVAKAVVERTCIATVTCIVCRTVRACGHN